MVYSANICFSKLGTDVIKIGIISEGTDIVFGWYNFISYETGFGGVDIIFFHFVIIVALTSVSSA